MVITKRILTTLSILAAATLAPAADSPPTFDADVLAVLKNRCLECHNSRKRSGRLNLETAVGVARGGETGEIVVAGRPDASRLWQKIADEEMPPDGPLGESERATIRDWIAAGAHGLPPREQVGRAGDGADHWAFQPIEQPRLPEPADSASVRNDVDRFIQAKLESKGLTLGPQAERLALLRRLAIDLTGLPPTPAEVAAFLADESADAYEQMVERYLASPRYGERWGRHWLDAAGYADSNGYFNADTDRPLAYRYRDYVIRSINDDKPFDRFLVEQLAGDELAGFRPNADVTGEAIDLLTATHYLRNGQDGTDSSDGNDDELLLDRFSVLEGAVQIIGSSLLGMTLQCARCHDHKFEPVTQAEYYQLQALLFPAYRPDQWLKAAERVVTIGTQAQREEHARQQKAIDDEIAASNKSVEATAEPLRKQLIAERIAKIEAPERDALQAAHDKPEAERSEEQKELVKQHADLLKVEDKDLDERFAELKQFREAAARRVKDLEKRRPEPLERISLLTEVSDSTPAHHVLVRGAYRDLGPEVEPGVPAAFCGRDATDSERQYLVPPKSEGQYTSGRRLAFARWLTSPRNPLLARVTVNRAWQHHFGAGIVATSDNFGYTGTPPTHPELLDYLAADFVENGWSLKRLHRQIVLSATYRQSSLPQAVALEVDPRNELLWRYPLRRLDAETLRDATLAATGELDETMFGPYVPTTRQPDGAVVVKDDEPGRFRRSLYLQQRRTQTLTLLDLFDAPAMVTNCARRSQATVTLQSLTVLNSQFFLERATALAGRLAREGGPRTEDRVALAFLLTQSRSPTVDERQAAIEFIVAQPANYEDNAHAERLAWRDFCQMLLASNSFLYIE